MAKNSIKIGIVVTLFFYTLMPTLALGFTASVATNYKYDSNVYKTKDDEVPDFSMTVKPSFSTEMLYKNFEFGTSYSTDYGRFVDRRSEDYLRQNLSLSFKSDLKAQYFGQASYSYQSSFDVRGDTGSTETVTPDIWSSNSTNGTFRYTANESDTQYSVDLGYAAKRYDIAESKVKDSDSVNVRFTNDFKLSGKTRVFYSIEVQEVKYVSSNSGQFNSSEMDYLVGLNWFSSGKVKSHANIGWKTKKNTSDSGRKFSDWIADMKINWMAKSYSHYLLSIARNMKTSPVTNDVNLITNSLEISWNHRFTRKLSTILKLSNAFNEFDSGESDMLISMSPSVSYAITRRLTMLTSFNWNLKNATLPETEYDSYGFSLQFSYNYANR